jgi:hypothetical protein
LLSFMSPSPLVRLGRETFGAPKNFSLLASNYSLTRELGN